MGSIKDSNIILIGPSGAGKSTLGKLLGEKLSLPSLDLDELRWSYYDEIGYDKEKAGQLRREQSFVALVDYWEQFSIYALERVIEDHPLGYVISTGAGSAIFNNADYNARAQKALESYPFIVLLLPSADQDSCVRICTERIQRQNPEMKDVPGSPLAVNATFIRRSDYRNLAKIIIYNGDQTPDETCQTIVHLINHTT